MKRYIITTAQAHAPPHKQFYENLEAFKRDSAEFDAEMYFIPTFGKEAKQTDLRNAFLDYNIIDEKLNLNRSIEVQRRRIRPQMIDPVTGLSHIVRDGKSVIFESPQIRLKTIPTNPNKLPKFLLTTGAITRPNYAGKNDAMERQRLGKIAKDNHTYGAIVVDVVNDTKYHFRHLHANYKGEFVDFGTWYSEGKAWEAECEALIYADWHNESGLPENYSASKRLAKELKPKIGVFHDFFDGHSVNPHMRNELIYQQIREGVDKDHLNLEKELYACGKELSELIELHDEIYLVQSNHHEFLNRWLDEGQFIKDPKNARLGFELAKQYSYGVNPVKAGIELVYGTLDDRIHFLENDDILRVKKFKLDQHGHKGPNGGRGSIKNREEMYGRTIGGHHHSPEERHHNETVGTHLPRNIFYAKGGPSGWLCRNSAIFNTGTKQSYNIIDGEYR